MHSNRMLCVKSVRVFTQCSSSEIRSVAMGVVMCVFVLTALQTPPAHVSRRLAIRVSSFNPSDVDLTFVAGWYSMAFVAAWYSLACVILLHAGLSI